MSRMRKTGIYPGELYLRDERHSDLFRCHADDSRRNAQISVQELQESIHRGPGDFAASGDKDYRASCNMAARPCTLSYSNQRNQFFHGYPLEHRVQDPPGIHGRTAGEKRERTRGKEIQAQIPCGR